MPIVSGTPSHSSLVGSDTVLCGCRACCFHKVEWFGLSREVVSLSGLVDSVDFQSMLQISLGQPEVLQTIALEPNQVLVLRLFVGADQSVLRCLPPQILPHHPPAPAVGPCEWAQPLEGSGWASGFPHFEVV